MPDVSAVVHELFDKSGGDETILDYVIGVLDDEHFEFGDDGEDAFDSLGALLVEGGLVPSEAAAREACRQLAQKLSDKPVVDTVRRLESGPVQLDQADPRQLLYKEFDAKHMIQTQFGTLPNISERDKARIEKLRAKEEAQQRAAFMAHQERAAATAKGGRPVIVRNKGSGGCRDVHLDNFNVSNGGKDLIQDATITLSFGRRYGLIGRNGTGKTTLLRALASKDIKGIPDNFQVLHVEQEVSGDDTSVLQSVLGCDVERSTLLEEEEEILKKLNKDRKAMLPGGQQQGPGGEAAAATAASTSPADPAAAAAAAAPSDSEETALTQRLTAIYQRLEEIDAFGAETKAAMVLAGLSFDNDMMQRPTKTFSGGWRMRIALAQALFVEPDLLLLDEPTNHLDLHAVLWLEEYLLKWPKTLIAVSHAREFLNSVCTDIIHLHSCKLITYKGDYNTFMRTMTERIRNARKAAEAAEVKRKHVQAFIDRFRFNANRAALVQSRIKALERMAEVEEVEEDPEYRFEFPTPDCNVSPPIISFNNVSFGYPGGPILYKNLDFGLDLESRFAIVGPNGIGKSTLLKLIGGELEPTTGVITRNPKVRLATFSQHHVDGLDLAFTPLQIMLKAYPDLKEQEARAHLGSFGVGGTLALQPLYTLSGGQKSRVAFAKLTFTKPHILLLDEPSNHLDIDAVNALIEGLATFKGGVLMVSHDQYLIEATVDELWMCEDGQVTPFHGTFVEYKQRLRAMNKL